MTSKNPRVDTYIANSEEFARPILKHIRALVHQACPDVEEAIKWGFPFFSYQGPMCHMASFKKHCVMGFWKAALMKDERLMANARAESAMGHLGKVAALTDLPADRVLLGYIREAALLNETGAKLPSRPRQSKASAELATVPEDLASGLDKHPAAKVVFDAFSASKRKDYITWLAEAKTEATRRKRLDTALAWIAEGKSRNWKYE